MITGIIITCHLFHWAGFGPFGGYVTDNVIVRSAAQCDQLGYAYGSEYPFDRLYDTSNAIDLKFLKRDCGEELADCKDMRENHAYDR